MLSVFGELGVSVNQAPTSVCGTANSVWSVSAHDISSWVPFWERISQARISPLRRLSAQP